MVPTATNVIHICPHWMYPLHYRPKVNPYLNDDPKVCGCFQ